MDIYIKMCEEAREIQKLWKPKDWDRFIYRDDRKLGIVCLDEEYNKADMEKVIEHYIWLPTQEQLWNIPTKKFPVYISFAERCFIIINRGLEIEWHFDGEDLNECLIQYVMKGNYGKEWNKGKEKWGRK